MQKITRSIQRAISLNKQIMELHQKNTVRGETFKPIATTWDLDKHQKLFLLTNDLGEELKFIEEQIEIINNL